MARAEACSAARFIWPSNWSTSPPRPTDRSRLATDWSSGGVTRRRAGFWANPPCLDVVATACFVPTVSASFSPATTVSSDNSPVEAACAPESMRLRSVFWQAVRPPRSTTLRVSWRRAFIECCAGFVTA
ncbi:MAG: hypothetical protein M5U12_02970 [Verrucomicrobia bacterium]|nr:hypothetical protein [Verrucomicrobiota bacterium]